MPALAATSKQKLTPKASNSASLIVNQPRKQEACQSHATSNNSGSMLLAKKVFLTKCPHVVLIGNISHKDLDHKSLLRYQQNKRKSAPKSTQNRLEQEEHASSTDLVQYETSRCHDEDADAQRLKCEECEKSKNLWVCLREDCRFVGCGQDLKSNEHSNLHSTVRYRGGR